MMRVTVRGLLVGGSVGVLLTTALLWTQCHPPPSQNEDTSQQQLLRQPLQTQRQSLSLVDVDHEKNVNENYLDDGNSEMGYVKTAVLQEEDEGSLKSSSAMGIKEILCNINHEYTISCHKDSYDVYVPFSFLEKYFEIYGHLRVDSSGDEVFDWSHSYSQVYEQQDPYSSSGLFLNFDMYKVEARDRVKCLSADEGVPISTQWYSAGYHYPTQIAQFGLSHYSKHFKEPSDSPRFLLEDGSLHLALWKLDGAQINRNFDKDCFSQVLHFSALDSVGGKVVLWLNDMPLSDTLVLSLDLKLVLARNTSFSLTLKYKEKRYEVFHLHYIMSSSLLEGKGSDIYYGLGESNGWKRITRNIPIDLQKGLLSLAPRKKLRKHLSIKLVSITLRGEGSLDNLTLSKAEHLSHFYDAANWLLRHQNAAGGWPIPVKRTIVDGLLELKPGWYSAMAQGQAMSLLVRAGHHSGDYHYLNAALLAANLFEVNSTEGGIRAFFPGNFVWFEEYPTKPSLFVLNGFMYSLFGLYDLKESKIPGCEKANELFESGMKSLRNLLPLFDAGSVSLYDLRHFSAHIEPNIARWDYHALHITQLLQLASVDSSGDPVLSEIGHRWKEYMSGHRARHN